MDNNVGMAQRYEHGIPEGYEARIEGNKVIIERKESVDERIRKEIVCFFDLFKTSGIWGHIRDVNTWIAYLERQKEQKPDGGSSEKPNNHAEWSEEDEAAFGDLIWCIEQARKSAKDENDLGNIWFTENWVKNRLKSIRPQSHWKPSKEQLSALKEQTSWLSKDNPLHSLYYQLCEL